MKINEVSRQDFVALEFMSASDQDQAHEIAAQDSIEVLQSGTGSRPSIFNIERSSLHGSIFVSHLRHSGIEFDDLSGEGHVPAMMQGKSAAMRDAAEEQGIDLTELPFTTDLDEMFSKGAKGFKLYGVDSQVAKALHGTFPEAEVTFNNRDRQATVRFDEPITDEIDRKMDRFKSNWLVKSMALNEGISIGSKHHIMVYDMMRNQRVPRQVEIVDYIKAPGQRDMVVYKDGKGKVKKMAVNVFKSRLESTAERMGEL